jgi:signal transduction histidine kinase
LQEIEASKRLLEHFLEREQDARREADGVVRQKQRILTEVAHELRTPLGSIAGWLRVLGQGRTALADRRRALISMTRSVRALARLIEELTENARFEQHKIVLDVANLGLLRVVLEVIEDLRPLAELKQIDLELLAHPHKIEVCGDAWRLQQMFRNLIGNAIKFTPEHGSVRVAIGVVGPNAEVEITDTGCGIAPEAMSSIFEPFAQPMRLRSAQGGLGLGLSIAKRVVELHDGAIHVQSEGVGCGSTFRVRLRLSDAD